MGLALALAGSLLTPGVAQASRPAPPLDPPGPGPASERSRAGWKGQLALTRAERAWGAALPTGAGVVALHVEGGPQTYAPDVNAATFTGVRFILHDGPADPTGHATMTATRVYGPRGAAPGIRTVHAMSAARWMTHGYLRTGDLEPPEDLAPPPRVMSHSWIATGQTPQNAAVLRRLDFAIDSQDVLCFVGVNNDRGTAVPELLASAHNAIAVGRADGSHSTGGTRFEAPGRIKPDLCAPGATTSAATPTAAAMGARLIEFAGRNEHPGDEKAETLKAVLYAGAHQPKAWAPVDGRALDPVYGAGVIDLDRSLRILDAGPAGPGELTARYGWWFGQADPSSRVATWRFFNPEPTGEARISLIWHRRIGGPRLTGEAVADFDLRLMQTHNAEGQPLEAPVPVAASESKVDNAEQLSVDGLPAGGYRLLVVRNPDRHPSPWDYALAWRLEGDSEASTPEGSAPRTPSTPESVEAVGQAASP